MTKWFDTNYHYLVPELEPGPALRAARRRTGPSRCGEAAELGIATRPVVLGPAQLPAALEGPRAPARRARRARPGLRASCCASCAAAGRARGAARRAVPRARSHGARARRLRRRLDARCDGARRSSSAWRPTSPASRGRPSSASSTLPVAELHLDLVRAPAQLAPALERCATRRRGSRSACSTAATSGPPTSTARSTRSTRAIAALGERPRHDRPVVLAAARPLRGRARDARSTAEVRGVAGLRRGEARRAGARSAGAVAAPGRARRAARRPRARRSARGAPRRAPTTPRCAAASARCGRADYDRGAPSAERREAQRAARRRCPSCRRRRSARSRRPTRSAPRAATCARAARCRPTTSASSRRRSPRSSPIQEQLGLDVLVHGEPERNDMVEYFGEQLRGFAFSDARLGAVLRQPLREAADPLRRRLAARRR